MSRIAAVAGFGQQIWLDNISRNLLDSGELQRWISEHNVSGVTSNPAIFYNAIARDAGYQADLARLRREERDAERRFERLVLPDIQRACDFLRPLYEASGANKGYVSFEVSPSLSRDANATLAAATRLWREINRPNAMIKIPATAECLPAITGAIAAGINVNVTLMFSPAHVRGVFDAYIRGLEQRNAAGLPLDHIRSVASIFVSRVDTLADKQIPETHSALRGQLAVASARQAYQSWKTLFAEARFAELRARGAVPQWCLWASTGTKNPAYSDVLYLESLIGADTVNTVPDATLAAFADHGQAGATLEQQLETAREVIASCAALGLDLDVMGEQLQQEGLRAFEEAFAKLLACVE